MMIHLKWPQKVVGIPMIFFGGGFGLHGSGWRKKNGMSPPWKLETQQNLRLPPIFKEVCRFALEAFLCVSKAKMGLDTVEWFRNPAQENHLLDV